MKRKVKRFNGENDSYVETSNNDVEDILADAREEYERRQAAKESDISSSYMPRSTFKQEAIGDATNDNIRVRKYTPRKKSVAPKKAQPSKTEGLGMAGSDTGYKKRATYESTPVKTSKEKIEDIKSQTPLQNRQGGFHLINALNRIQGVGTEAMKESARQARVDRIRRNVGSNLETYGMKKGGKVSSASSRADGCAQRGKTKGRII